MNYRRELTPNIKFQADRIFVRNDLFEQVIKSCKSASTEFLMFKGKLGICPYGELNEKIFEVSNETSTKDLIEESDESGEYSDEELDEEFKNSSIEKLKKVFEKEKKNWLKNQLKNQIKNQTMNQLKK